eukprot:TRINITY_DN17824_c0_g1_i1.p1 TRINITY_DN17824_c0_g1~~TRINITY_DN17824_c0_g1_i1.p1  ORF type:complete len:103 (-),score=15.62 TRINITY_DN17824_c0_g1_i1:41-349(-)
MEDGTTAHRENNFRELAPSLCSWAFKAAEAELWEHHRSELARRWGAAVSRLQVYHTPETGVQWLSLFVNGNVDPANPHTPSNIEFLFPIGDSVSTPFSTPTF